MLHKKNTLLLPATFAGLVLLPLLLLFCLQAGQYLLKMSITERFENKGLQLVQLHKDSVQWENPGKELVINGRYFDVKHLEQKGKMLVLTGHYDDVETLISQLLQMAVEFTSGNGLSELLLLLQCMISLPLLHFFLRPIKSFIIYSKPKQNLYRNPFLSLTALPPWAF